MREEGRGEERKGREKKGKMEEGDWERLTETKWYSHPECAV